MQHLLYDIVHVTDYDYQGAVSVSHHLLRLEPRQTARQRCLRHEFRIFPEPSVLTSHGDYFGNRAHFIAVERPHGSLSITSRARVAVSPAFLPDASETPAWETVRTRCRADRTRAALEANEYTHASPLVPTAPEFADYALGSFLPSRPIFEALSDLMARLQADFRFDPTATTVSTPLAEFHRNRRGVCQDFAHFLIACLRSIGLPARYVSGYLETDPPPGLPKLRGVDASHAWVSLFCPGIGWIDADPTNNCYASLRHLSIGWGRDYGDIAPVRGVLIGGTQQILRVSVDVTALAPEEDDADAEDADSQAPRPLTA
jgi:transglutaminase-like putative cysteine protease